MNFFILQHKDQIKCFFKSQTMFSLFSPETKSNNENRDNTILGINSDLIFLLLFQCFNCFSFSTDSVFTPAVLPVDILRHQVSSSATDSTKFIWKPVQSRSRSIQVKFVHGQGNDKKTPCSTKDGYLYILMLYMHSHMRINSILGYSPTVMPENRDV